MQCLCSEELGHRRYLLLSSSEKPAGDGNLPERQSQYSDSAESVASAALPVPELVSQDTPKRHKLWAAVYC